VAPPILRTNYGTCAWEYASPLAYFGAKSTNGASKYTVGPPAAYNPALGSLSGTNDNVQLNYVPQDIRMARFSLYVLYEDQSYGVHNPTYTSNLLAWAENDVITNFITAQWPATFTAGPLSGSLAGNGGSLTVNFTNNVSASSYSWNFGDNSGTVTGANPSHPYTTPGLYSVTCTANGSSSLTRTNFILVQP
jgi:PKD repeat protein